MGKEHHSDSDGIGDNMYSHTSSVRVKILTPVYNITKLSRQEFHDDAFEVAGATRLAPPALW